jgi:SAM-dependent methyltransferase
MEFVSWLREENRKNDQRSLHTIKVFDTFVERYDAWFDSPFGKSAFNLEKSCIISLCRNLKRPSLEIGVGTGRFAEALGTEYGVDISGRVLEFAKRRGIKYKRPRSSTNSPDSGRDYSKFRDILQGPRTTISSWISFHHECLKNLRIMREFTVRMRIALT